MMIIINSIHSFRIRISLVLILTLLITTGIIYKLNQEAEKTIIDEVNQQQEDLAEAINIAVLAAFC